MWDAVSRDPVDDPWYASRRELDDAITTSSKRLLSAGGPGVPLVLGERSRHFCRWHVLCPPVSEAKRKASDGSLALDSVDGVAGDDDRREGSDRARGSGRRIPTPSVRRSAAGNYSRETCPAGESATYASRPGSAKPTRAVPR